jgi:plastocyanin
MKRWLSFCLFMAIVSCAQAATSIVDVGGATLTFSPQVVTVNVGDSVVFINKGGFHNVVADDGSFRCARGCDGDGKGGNGNASSSNWIAAVNFAQAGTVGYFCEIHGQPGVGMFGTIVVQGANPPPPLPIEPIPAVGFSLLALLSGGIVAVALATARRRGRR